MKRFLVKIRSEAGYLTSWHLASPQFVSLQITKQCNFHCLACELWKVDQTKLRELDWKEWQNIIFQLKKCLDKETFIEINGGEPLMRDNLVLNMIGSLKDYFLSVTLNTNGFFLDSEMIKKLDESRLDAIKISLYSLDETIHDKMRQVSGACSKAKSALQLIRKSKIKPEVGILVTALNINSIPDLIMWLEKNNIKAIIQPLDEVIKDDNVLNENLDLPSEFWPKPEDVKKTFQWLRKNNTVIKNSPAALEVIEAYYLRPCSSLRSRCFVGQRNLVIHPDGKIAFCFKNQPFGDLFAEKDLAKLLRGEKARLARKKIKKCRKYCRVLGCNFHLGFREYFSFILSPKKSDSNSG